MTTFRTGPSVFQSMKAYIQALDSTLTDFNVGSTLFDFFTAISRSIGDLYTELKNVSNAAYVTTAQGTDLDIKVADYGLTRKVATSSAGYVTFYRGTVFNKEIIINSGTIVQTPSTNTDSALYFQTTADSSITALVSDEAMIFLSGKDSYEFSSRFVGEIVQVTGTYNSSGSYVFEQDVDYILNTASSIRHRISWLEAATPDINSYFYVTYKPTSAEVPVACVSAGKVGNISANKITVIPTAPAGIEYVNNFNSIYGGTDAESDAQLRIRVPLYLNTLARAVKDSLIQQALSVSGVVAASLYEPDPPTGYITLFIDDGSGNASTTLIRSVRDLIYGEVEGVPSDSALSYKAVGIYVLIKAPTSVTVSVSTSITVDNAYDKTTIEDLVRTAIFDLIASLGTGQPVKRAKVIDVIMSVSGVLNLDVANLEIQGLKTGDFSAADSEVLRTSNDKISITSVYQYITS